MNRATLPLLGQALTSLVLVAAGLVAYDRLVVRPSLLVGVVDVAEVYRAKEAEFTQLLTKSGNEEDRQQALTMAKAFSQRLPSALDELSQDCRCLVLLKSAVASGAHAIDLTPHLRRKVQSP